MNYIPIIALVVLLHFIGAVITAVILLKVTEHDPKPEYPDEGRCIELESFLWEFVLIIYLLLAIILFGLLHITEIIVFFAVISQIIK